MFSSIIISMNHKDISSLPPSEYKKELELYENVCNGICKYMSSVCKDCTFDVIKDSFSDTDEVAIFWRKLSKNDGKVYRHCHSVYHHVNEGGYLRCYMDMMDYWFRNMAIDLDDVSYDKWTKDEYHPFTCIEENVRKRTYIKFPCYDNIRKAVIMMRLQGINLI